MRESRDTSVGKDVDFAGVATLTVGLTALVLALVEGNSWGWGSTEVVGLLAGSVLALAAFVAIEHRVKAPMVQFDLLSDRNFLGAVVVALIITFAMMGVFFFLALYMQNILHYSPLEAGVRFLPSTLMIVAIAPISGRLADRFGPRWLIAGGLLLVTASLVVFTGLEVDSSYTDLLPGFMLLGIGIALTMSPMTTAAMNAVPVQKAGIASGVLSMFRMVGGSLGIAVTGAIFQGSVGSNNFAAATPQKFVDALSSAMAVSAAVALFGAIVAVVAIRAKGRAVSVEAAEAALSPGGSTGRRGRGYARPGRGQPLGSARSRRGSVSTLTLAQLGDRLAVGLLDRARRVAATG